MLDEDQIGQGGGDHGHVHPPLPIEARDHFAVDFGVLGRVSVGFA